MFEKIRKLKDRKGFTLVELIVVLVILAILAALLIPALTGYIDKANKDKVVAECRQVVVAAQTVASEAYGQNKTINSASVKEIKELARLLTAGTTLSPLETKILSRVWSLLMVILL